jgi:hypothetical protein
MLIIDPHVHFHNSFDENAFLTAIRENFNQYASQYGIESCQKIICFTESEGIHYFQKLRMVCKEGGKLFGFTVSATKNQNAVLLQDNSGFSVFFISGKQIVTKENLEILALGLLEDFADGVPINDVIPKVIDHKCLPVLPWGFGKWTGTRGKIVEELIASNKYDPFFLGDNGNRPEIVKMSEHFVAGIDKKMINLQGSDPLPFKSEAKKAGSFGVMVGGEVDEETPFDSLYAILSDKSVKVTPYGKLETTLNFVKNQVAMQIVKRLR